MIKNSKQCFSSVINTVIKKSKNYTNADCL